MAARALNREESLGLGLAVLGHAALVAWLMLHRPAADLPPPPARMEVMISDESAAVSTSPEPQAVPAPDKGPVLGEAPPPPAPFSSPAVKPAPAPTAITPPRPMAKPSVQTKQPTHAQQQPPKATTKSTGKSGASVLDPSYWTATPGAKTNGTSQNQSAPITGAVRSSLAGAVTREIKPKWRGRVPEGLDAEKLVTILTWDLNPDGSLAGSPRVVRQEGTTPGNRAQAARHAEEAIRAVRLAAPFDLPPQYYSAWKHISEFRFDKSLGQ